MGYSAMCQLPRYGGYKHYCEDSVGTRPSMDPTTISTEMGTVLLVTEALKHQLVNGKPLSSGARSFFGYPRPVLRAWPSYH